MKDSILKVQNMNVAIHSDGYSLPVLQEIDLEIKKGEILSLVGESGCGKSVFSLSLTKLLPSKAAEYISGKVQFLEDDLWSLPATELRHFRGKHLAYIFQEPMATFDPLQKIQKQMVESYKLHISDNDKEATEKAKHLLSRVGITDLDQRLDSYPNEFSGGMLQRVAIATSLMCDPQLLIADEPTSAIDVTIQSQLVELLLELKDELGMSILFISHDLGLVSSIADRVAVMYAGRLVEIGDIDSVIDSPIHPYTQDLISSVPSLREPDVSLEGIPGIVPSPLNYPKGCHYNTRCKWVMDRCLESKPELTRTIEDHSAACFLSQKEVSLD